jgi:hypothetical protein
MLTWWRQNGSTGSGHAARLVCVIWSQCGSPSGLCVTWERASIVPEDLPLCEGRAVLWADGANKLIHCCQELTSYLQLAVLHFNWNSGTPGLDSDLSRTVSATAPTFLACFSSWNSSGYFNIQQLYVLPTQCIYVFCVELRTNSDYFPIQYKLSGFYNRDLTL